MGIRKGFSLRKVLISLIFPRNCSFTLVPHSSFVPSIKHRQGLTDWRVAEWNGRQPAWVLLTVLYGLQADKIHFQLDGRQVFFIQLPDEHNCIWNGLLSRKYTKKQFRGIEKSLQFLSLLSSPQSRQLTWLYKLSLQPLVLTQIIKEAKVDNWVNWVYAEVSGGIEVKSLEIYKLCHWLFTLILGSIGTLNYKSSMS